MSVLTALEIQQRVAQTGRALTELVSLLGEQLEPASKMCLDTLANGGRILVCGNGGSAAQAQHLVAELVVRFETDRRALNAIALTADTAILTACGNDYGYERVFARQIEALGTAGDTLIAFSTSGKSKNIKEAIHAAHKKGMRILGISGNKGMNALCAIDIICPGSNTAIIQECHMVVTHLLCEAIERGVPK
jgi:D-sedoheptulose 7-phosphate isomerase